MHGQPHIRFTYSKWTETQQLTVIVRWKLLLVIVGDGTLPANQKIGVGGEEEEGVDYDDDDDDDEKDGIRIT